MEMAEGKKQKSTAKQTKVLTNVLEYNQFVMNQRLLAKMKENLNSDEKFTIYLSGCLASRPRRVLLILVTNPIKGKEGSCEYYLTKVTLDNLKDYEWEGTLSHTCHVVLQDYALDLRCHSSNSTCGKWLDHDSTIFTREFIHWWALLQTVQLLGRAWLEVGNWGHNLEVHIVVPSSSFLCFLDPRG